MRCNLKGKFGCTRADIINEIGLSEIDTFKDHEVAGRRNTPKLINFSFVFCCLLAASCVYSQTELEPSLRYHTSKPFIFHEERLPFYIDINNPTSADLDIVRIDITFSKLVDVRGVDDDCSIWLPGGVTAVVCLLPRVNAESTRQLNYYVVGDIAMRPGFSSSISATSRQGSISIIEPSPENLGLSDGDVGIEGTELSMSVVRNILFDVDRDGVPDINETILGTNPYDANSVSQQKPVIDVAILYSTLAKNYYATKIENHIERLITATNQFYRDNDIGITLRVIATEEVDYSENDSSLNSTFNNFSSQGHEAFNNLESIRVSSGADLLVFMHALNRPQGEIECGKGSTNGIALQGDFDRDNFGGQLLSVVDVSWRCLGLSDLAGLLASNMGIVPSRKENPEGGTFSFSAGYAIENLFATRTANTSILNTPPFGNALKLPRFSDPRRLCLGHPCGIDRSDVINGADAVFSLNATRYLISDLTPEVFPVSTADLEHKTTIDAETSSGFSLSQTSQHIGALENDWVTFNVEAENLSTVAQHNLEFRFFNLMAPAPVRTSDQRCTILGESVSNIPVETAGLIENRGEMVCYIAVLNPGQVANFSYAINIEETESLEGDAFVRQFAAVNNIVFPSTELCLPVYSDLISAATGNDVCARFAAINDEASDPPTNPDDLFDLTLKPSIAGSILTAPYISLFDGSLLSAQFRVGIFEDISLELIDYEFLNPELQPEAPSFLNSQQELEIRGIQFQGTSYNLFLKFIEGSDPATFSDLVITQI